MIPFLFTLSLSATPPSAEARKLGRELAEQGTLATLLPLQEAKETEELVKEDPSLSASEQAQLRVTADRVFKVTYDRLMKATGDAYAENLSLTDLRALTRFFRSPLAARYRFVTPKVLLATISAIGNVDFKGDVRAAYCAEAKRLCSKK